MSKQTKAVATTLLKVFVAACLAQIIASGAGVLDLGTDGYRAVLGSGVGAVVVAAYNWISPNDARYGVGSNSDAESAE